ncbi:DUF4333 domain-containing protein [Brachybacterium hainanense]|uniref:DUF4333 domain-containing protein n=1 Tax=Brachybacterium hainanense TaxID=1541174 RepID=A0ABV6RDC3_9MICO
MSARRIRPAALLLLPVATLALAGCSIGGASAVSQADVEQQVTDTLTQQVGQAPDSVDCPGDLPAEVGASLTCVLSAGGQTIDVAVTVTGVEDGTVSFDVQVADAVN